MILPLDSLNLNRKTNHQGSSTSGAPIMDESEVDRTIRLKQEREAKLRSNAIDMSIRSDAAEWQRRKRNAIILLVGQAESGKSTVLKNMQLRYAPKAFQAEANAWRAVIYLNLVRSVNFVVTCLSDAKEFNTDWFTRFKMKLEPLQQVEKVLGEMLCGVEDENKCDMTTYRRDGAPEVRVRSVSGWKRLLGFQRSALAHSSGTDELSGVRNVICGCRDDIIQLWEDPLVQSSLRDMGIELERQSGFFLAEVSLIATANYCPPPEHILRARLQTLCVEEHRIKIEKSFGSGEEWIVYDVGGFVGRRVSWAPYLEEANILIFLAPVSAFNQTLAEDERINRLNDSLSLWKSLCSNRLLSKVQFILFLNKMDLLDAKLKSGIEFSCWVKSYAGANDAIHVAKYLSNKFRALHQQSPITPRPLHIHLTCAVDTNATGMILGQIRELILQDVLRKTSCI